MLAVEERLSFDLDQGLIFFHSDDHQTDLAGSVLRRDFHINSLAFGILCAENSEGG